MFYDDVDDDDQLVLNERSVRADRLFICQSMEAKCNRHLMRHHMTVMCLGKCLFAYQIIVIRHHILQFSSVYDMTCLYQ